MRRRRYSITYQEAELIILSLTALIEEVEENQDFYNSPYWQWNLRACKTLKQKLLEYKWEV